MSTGAALAYLAKFGYVERWSSANWPIWEKMSNKSKTVLRQLVRFGCVEKRPMPPRPRPF